jgi:rare lipoprotein A
MPGGQSYVRGGQRRVVGREALRLAVVVAAAGIVASCSSPNSRISYNTHSKEYFSERSYGAASPRVYAGGKLPKGGGHAVVGDPYRVAGKTYIPRDNPRYSSVGLASWYGDAFHGRLTANGEVYDVNGLTAAHPTLPLPCYARVTNVENGRSMVVRVNDRGPFASDRIIDVSERVAGMLGFEQAGTANVKVDYVGPAQMDGLDENKLLASYRGPDAGGSMFAANNAPVPSAPVALASVAAVPRPVLATYRPVPVQAAVAGPLVLDPVYAPATDGNDDPLAPLIMRTGFVSSYASSSSVTAAQAAADSLAQPDALQAALNRATAKKALQLGVAPQAAGAAAAVPAQVMQIGSFGDPQNAGRVAANFGRFGRVVTDQEQIGGRSLTVVRVTVDPSVPPSAVVAAAQQIGLNGVFVTAR